MSSTPQTLTIERRFAAPRAEVFRYWTEAHLLRQWYAPVDDWVVGHAEVQPGAGGHYLVRFGPAPDGDAYTEAGTYRIFDDAERLVIAGSVDGDDVSDESTIEVRFTDDGDGTLVTISETGLVGDAFAEHAEGWQTCMERLVGALSAR